MMKKKDNKEEEGKKRLCDDSRKIQSILSRGQYKIKKWPNAEGKDNYYLVPRGKQPWEGVYICRADD